MQIRTRFQLCCFSCVGDPTRRPLVTEIRHRTVGISHAPSAFASPRSYLVLPISGYFLPPPLPCVVQPRPANWRGDASVPCCCAYASACCAGD